MPGLKFLIGLLIVIAVTAFVLYNMEVVAIRYYFGPRLLTLPLGYVITGAFLGGFLIAWVLRDLKRWRVSRELKKIRRAERTMEEELATLRRQLEETTQSAREALQAAAHSSGEEVEREAEQGHAMN